MRGGSRVLVLGKIEGSTKMVKRKEPRNISKIHENKTKQKEQSFPLYTKETIHRS